MNYNYNPLQGRIDYLTQQKAMIEQQLQSLQQTTMPSININNMAPTNNNGTNYDGNFKWVDGEEQAKQIANNNLPLILFDNNNPMFYMRNMDGSFKKFKFQEVIDATPTTNSQVETKINDLEAKLNTIIKALGNGKQEPSINTSIEEKTPTTASKQATKGTTK